MIGQVIENEYEVVDKIGAGGFGVVYRCKDLTLPRFVALKTILPERAGQKELERLLREARIMASIDHPNVVKIFRLGQFEGMPYILMEHLDGRTLTEFLRGPRLPLTKSLHIMQQVASGLASLHDVGIAHRDLSTNNIMVNDAGLAKILDLGLSKGVDDITTLTSENCFFGTLPYVSPEQVRGLGATASSDVFSFGVVLYEMLTGRNPFSAEHHTAVLYNISNKTHPPLETYLPESPKGLSALLDGCLEKDPGRRTSDLLRIGNTLDKIAHSSWVEKGGEPTTAVVVSRAKPTPCNPYFNRVMIKRREDFFGRQQEVKRIYARLNATPPGSISIVGDRKIGKSSLLNYIYMRQNRETYLDQADRMVMVFVDLQEEKNMSLESFVKALVSLTQMELRGRLQMDDEDPTLDGIKRMVQRMNESGFRLAILLDEFEVITTNENFSLEFFSFLRFLANHYDVAYITSSGRDLQVLCHTKEISDSPFFNIFSIMGLTPFRPGEARDLIRIPSERVGHDLEPYADMLVDLAGLFPFFLQIACCHAIEYFDELAEGRKPNLEEIRRRYFEEARLHYRYVWENFSEDERVVLVRTIQDKNIPDSLRHVLVELGRRQYVMPTDFGVGLFSSTFRDFVVSECRGKRKSSFFGRLFGKTRSTT